MAEEETNSRVAELKARLEADPGSRVFYQLGEELRKSGHADEAEAVLRQGLEHHSGYLSAWISLGRVLKEMSRYDEALEVLNRAFELDRQNVVVARLLGETYSDTGDHVEAIKKYKLVAALHPADEEVQARIAALEQILGPDESESERAGAEKPSEDRAPIEPAEPVSEAPSPQESPEDSSIPDTGPAAVFDDDAGQTGGAAGDVPPPPFDAEDAALFGTEESAAEPALDWQDDTSALDDGADMSQGDQSSWDEDIPPARSEVESDRVPAPDSGDQDDVVATITMGDLYARQGHVEQARSIYRKILDREPDHEAARGRLELLSDDEPGQEPDPPSSGSPKEVKVRRLEEWLSKVRS